MSIWCQICTESKTADDCIQLIPCLHTFCKECITEASKYTKVCPFVHCYSSISPADVVISTCEAEVCLKKIVISPEILRTACHHDICQHCFDTACRREKLSCPAPGCGEPMLDEEDMVCDGPCKQTLVYDRTITLPCCGARMCEDCGADWTKGQDFCAPGKCVVKETGKRKKTAELVRQPCLCTINCEGEVLRNFPSEFECDHDCCLNCLAGMLDKCEKSGKAPYCPNKACGIPYRCESVLSLRAQFPEKKDYFSKFTLSVQFSMQTLKDDTVMNILNGEPAENMGRKFTLKIGHCDDDDAGLSMDFVCEGSLGDLIREVRRVLKILATDKIYGYYRVERDKPPQILEVSQKTVRKTCAELEITERTTILVDTTGIVARNKKQ